MPQPISFYQNLNTSFYEKREKMQNAPITIRDLVLSPQIPLFSQGEVNLNTNPYSTLDMHLRLNQHIEFLFDLANDYHRQAYCLEIDGKFYLPERFKNTITRLSLNEFALYGRDYLTIADFKLLLEKIDNLARNSSDNVHLCLSSIPVLDSNGKVLNCTLYIKGGRDSQIQNLVKTSISTIDVTYPGLTNFSQISVPDSEVSSFIAGSNEEMISNNSIFELETLGGAKYVQAIDICLDHKFKRAKNLFMQQLAPNFPTDITHFLIPTQVDHIVSSNSIKLVDDAKISPSVLHVDPNSVFHDKENKDRSIEHKFALNQNKLRAKWATQYSQLELHSRDFGMEVLNPPFGSDFNLFVYQERNLATYLPEIAQRVKIANQKILVRKLANFIGEDLPPEEVSKAPSVPIVPELPDAAPLVVGPEIPDADPLESLLFGSEPLVLDNSEFEKMLEFFNNNPQPIFTEDFPFPDDLPLFSDLGQFALPLVGSSEPEITSTPMEMMPQSPIFPSFFKPHPSKRKHEDNTNVSEPEHSKRKIIISG